MEKNFLFEFLDLIKDKEGSFEDLIDWYFSLTPDNKNLVKRVKIKTMNEVCTNKPTKTLTIKGYELSRIANEFESIDYIPKVLKEMFPKLTHKDWKAFRRLVTLIFSSLEVEK